MLSAPVPISPIKKATSSGYSVSPGYMPFERALVGHKVAPFRLRHYVRNNTEYTLLTTLPTQEALNTLLILNPYIQDKILHALQMTYSYVTERIPTEGAEHYFCHVAATVYYEEHTGIDIKGRQHYKKASSLSLMLKNLLDEYQTPLFHRRLTDEQSMVLTVFTKILAAHKVATDNALQIISEEKKRHLQTYQNHTVDMKPVLLSPQKVSAVSTSYPAINLKNKTPKKMSKQDIDSVNMIKSRRSEIDAEFDNLSSSSSDEELRQSKFCELDDEEFLMHSFKSKLIFNEVFDAGSTSSSSQYWDSSDELIEDFELDDDFQISHDILVETASLVKRKLF
tara:strand:- start:101289 stop:102302 length:1014 start_codon:yes stop_codon:yes gene_type:complete